MTKINNLTPHDQKLLEEIEQILINDTDKRREDHSLLGFCTHLASTVPLAGTKFRVHLQENVSAFWKRLRTVQTEVVSNAEKPRVRLGSMLKRIMPDSFRTSRIFQLSGGHTMKRSFVLFTFAALIFTSLTVAFVPSVRAMVLDVIKQIVLGPNTVVYQVDPQTDPESRPLRSDMWIIRTDIGNFGGNAPPGVDPIVRSVDSFEEAQALTDFHLKAPTALPEGYVLLEVRLAPIGATSWAILFYTGPDHEIIIAQMPGGPQPSDDPNVGVAVKSGVITDGTMEELDFDGQPAAWIESHSLLWESEGISYYLGGLDLDLQLAINIARSLR
jgi:hypothetical protein